MFNNKIEQVKHLPLKIGEVARYVIVPGDPNRVEIIASVMDSYTLQGRNREFNAARGTYKGTDVSVVSTGIGCPSTAIAVEELAHVGAEVFIRIGTSGSLQAEVPVDSFVLSTHGLDINGMLHLENDIFHLFQDVLRLVPPIHFETIHKYFYFF